jgi:hypothetical protein
MKYVVGAKGLSATSQQYFSLTTNQPPTTSQQYSSLRTNQHQPSATSQPNRLFILARIKTYLELINGFTFAPVINGFMFVNHIKTYLELMSHLSDVWAWPI